MTNLRKSSLSLTWCSNRNCVAELVDFFVQNVSTRYISHGEIQDGRAVAIGKWSARLAEVMYDTFADSIRDGHGTRGPLGLAEARIEGKLVALAHVGFYASSNPAHGIVHDLVVARSFRGKGIGTRMLEWLEREAATLRLTYLFLESGVKNEDAHTFFHHHGFKTCSLVMMKRIARAKE